MTIDELVKEIEDTRNRLTCLYVAREKVILEAYRAGKTQSEIAARLNMSQQNISSVIKRSA